MSTVTIETRHATGPALNWLVAKSLGKNVDPWIEEKAGWLAEHDYENSWALAGPVIDREDIALVRTGPSRWIAEIDLGEGDIMRVESEGDSRLKAAMRCFAAYELGERVAIPEVLRGEIPVAPEVAPKAEEPSILSAGERRAIDDLRERGFAVIVWTPEELGDARPHRVSDRSIELGAEVIDILRSTKDTEDEDEYEDEGEASSAANAPRG